MINFNGKKPIEVVPYNENWVKQFESEVKNIRTALGDLCLAVHHLGSIAVPVSATKPI